MMIWTYKMNGELDSSICLISAAIAGIGLALLWTAHSVLILAYPTSKEQGRYIAIFWSIYNCGAAVGGLLTFSTNTTTKSHVPSTSTFFAFGLVTAIGVAMSCRLLPLNIVYRGDGVRVSDTLSRDPKAGLRYASYEMSLLVAMIVYDKRLHGLLLLFLYSNWFYAYCFGSFNFAAFNARSSGWNNCLYFCAQFGASQYVGKYLDDHRYTNHERGTRSLLVLGAFVMASWFLAFGIELVAPELRTVPVDLITVFKEGHPVLPIFISLVFVAWGLCDTFLQIWCYWIMSELYHGPDFSRAVGVYKAVQAVGAMCTWLCTLYRFPSSWMLHSNWILFTLALFPALRVCKALSAESDQCDAEELNLLIDQEEYTDHQALGSCRTEYGSMPQKENSPKRDRLLDIGRCAVAQIPGNA
eukprot:GEMP01024952.1.p1 GENE.GEMP01024952.1~~GEMP01024952.1.p1  ORF type:complete len:413 (-),score=44.58 GEMP01024952.1:883-2121(-)